MKPQRGFFASSALRAMLGRAGADPLADWPARPGRLGHRLRSLQRLVWPPRGLGSIAALALVLATGVVGASFGGHFDRWREEHGKLSDAGARFAGFDIKSVSISGNKELSRDEIMALTAITKRDSVAFLDVAEVRKRLKSQPLIADADVRKLMPDRIVISIVEREPFALWQLDGVVKIVSVDGTVIDEMRDDRFIRLPHVVGPGANTRVKEFAALLDAVPELRTQVRAGILVAERRWTLKLVNGVEVKLPERDPVPALRQLAALDKANRVLAKDILTVDLRVPGRAAFRLSEEAAAARAEMLDKKYKAKGRA